MAFYKTVTTTDTAAKSRGGTLFLVVVTGAASATNVLIKDGTDTNGTVMFEIDCGANSTVIVPCGQEGVRFGTGLYLDVDANTSRCTVVFD